MTTELNLKSFSSPFGQQSSSRIETATYWRYDKNNHIAMLYSVSDVMVLNDIIEQAAGRQSRGSEKAGTHLTGLFTCFLVVVCVITLKQYNYFCRLIHILLSCNINIYICRIFIPLCVSPEKKKRCTNNTCYHPV